MCFSGDFWLRHKEFIGCPVKWSNTLQVHPPHPLSLLRALDVEAVAAIM